MSTQWAIFPTDGCTHVLLLVGDHPLGMLQAVRCGHRLAQGVALHECLPGLLLCVTCLWCSLVPAPAFPRTIPAGRRLRDIPESTPRDQPVSAPVLRWARCPLDGTPAPACPGAGEYRGSRARVRLGGKDQTVSTRPHLGQVVPG
jgi:hypothetical protein